MNSEFHKNGKLLLSGEYAVLDGALALAVPTQFGQTFHINSDKNKDYLIWQALDHEGVLWFEAQVSLIQNKILKTNNQDVALALMSVLRGALELNPDCLKWIQGAKVKSRLDFPRSWGLGSSSTLIAAVAQWSQTNAFALSSLSFGGSGYDVAAADRSEPFTYRLQKSAPEINPVRLEWPFWRNIYFVHRNQKQNSRASIAHYRKNQISQTWIQEISDITRAMISSAKDGEFGALIKQHEALIAHNLGLTPVQEEFFQDFPGAIKSLGGWGGDFMMVLGPEPDLDSKPNFTVNYFKEKGFGTIIPYKDMIL